MPENPKLFIHNNVYYITCRTQTGLPIVCHPYMKTIITSKLARAKELFDIDISDLIAMANHAHFMIVATNPDNVDKFMKSFKGETAHMINRLTGVPKGNVWEDGYDSPPILDLHSLIEKVAYTYSNPQKANLVEKIEEYPNLNTWNVFRGKQSPHFMAKEIKRPYIEKIPKGFITERKARSINNSLLEQSQFEIPFSFSPKSAFNALDKGQMSYEEYQAKVIKKVRANELLYEEQRRAKGRSVMGAKNLKMQTMFKSHTPKSYGRKMICICSNIETRKSYIAWFKSMARKCKEIYQSWISGGNETFPPGFFPPGRRPVASVFPV